MLTKTNITEQDKQNWVTRYLSGETARSISKDYPISESTISRYFQSLGISRGKGNLYTEAFINQVLLEYQSEPLATYASLGKKYGISDRTISSWAKKRNIKTKQTSGYISNCNSTYFDIINTPNKAYLLGFITADGSITGKGDKIENCSIEVHEKDIALIYFAKSEINPQASITICKYQNKNNVRISFSSTYLATSLTKYGIVKNKSKIIEKVPIELIPDNLLRFYFRGLIDGDGCIHKDGGISIYSGSEKFIQDVQNILITKLNLTKLKIYHGTTYFITWHSKNDRQKLFDFLYKDCLNDTFYYPRKYMRLYNSLYDNTEVTSPITEGGEAPQSVEGE